MRPLAWYRAAGACITLLWNEAVTQLGLLLWAGSEYLFRHRTVSCAVQQSHSRGKQQHCCFLVAYLRQVLRPPAGEGYYLCFCTGKLRNKQAELSAEQCRLRMPAPLYLCHCDKAARLIEAGSLAIVGSEGPCTELCRGKASIAAGTGVTARWPSLQCLLVAS